MNTVIRSKEFFANGVLKRIDMYQDGTMKVEEVKNNKSKMSKSCSNPVEVKVEELPFPIREELPQIDLEPKVVAEPKEDGDEIVNNPSFQAMNIIRRGRPRMVKVEENSSAE